MEEYIFKTIRCIECKCILSSPVVLPCGNSVCQKHVPSSLEQSSFECHICGHMHEIPANNKGFAPNIAISHLLDQYSDEYKLTFGWCELLSSILAKFESLIDHPESYINATIGDLKSRIRLKRDELVREIEEKSEQILIGLDMYEKECTSSLDRLEDTRRKLSESVEKKKRNLTKVRDDLSSSFEISRWKSILENSELEVKELSVTMEKLKRFALMNKFDEFKKIERNFRQLRVYDVNNWERFSFFKLTI